MPSLKWSGGENVNSNVYNDERQQEQDKEQQQKQRTVRWANNADDEESFDSMERDAMASGESRTKQSTAAATPRNKMTPIDSSVGAASRYLKHLNDNAVVAYHFAGVPNTPWSTKKGEKKRKLKNRSEKRACRKDDFVAKCSIRSGEPSKIMNPINLSEKDLVTNDRDLLENTFNLGRTADIASIYGADLNNSFMSNDSRASGISSVGSAISGASDLDVMNCTTLSDTHELSTSNFIMSVKVRNVLQERAKSLGIGEFKKHAKETVSCQKISSTANASVLGKRFMNENPMNHIDTLHDTEHSERHPSRCIDEATMTLPNTVLTSSANMIFQSPDNANGNDEYEERNEKNEYQGNEAGSEKIDGISECTSFQKGPVPNKTLETQRQRNNNLVENSTKSSLKLNDLIADRSVTNKDMSEKSWDDNGSQLSMSDRFSLGFCSPSSERNEAAYDLSHSIKETDKAMLSESLQTNDADSTASQDYLDLILNRDEHTQKTNSAIQQRCLFNGGSNGGNQYDSHCKNVCVGGKLNLLKIDETKNQINNHITTPSENQFKFSPLRPSPTFFSGKKMGVILYRRKSMKDYIVTIQKQIASLRKERTEKKFGMVSNPVEIIDPHLVKKDGQMTNDFSKVTQNGTELTNEIPVLESVRNVFPDTPFNSSLVNPVDESLNPKSVTRKRSLKSPCASQSRKISMILRSKTSASRNSDDSNESPETFSSLDKSSVSNIDVVGHHFKSTGKKLSPKGLSSQITQSGKTKHNKSLLPVARNTRRLSKSPHPFQSTVKSPTNKLHFKSSEAESFNPTQNNQSGYTQADSPARNTRSSHKAIPPMSPSVNSPPSTLMLSARNNVASSISPNVNSPTFSAETNVQRSETVEAPADSLEISLARSLFLSPLAPNALYQIDPSAHCADETPDVTTRTDFYLSTHSPEQFSYRAMQRNKFSPTSELAEVSPQKKSADVSSESSKLDDSLSLSQEYPFLSLKGTTMYETIAKESLKDVDNFIIEDSASVNRGSNTLVSTAPMNIQDNFVTFAKIAESNCCLTAKSKEGVTINCSNHIRKKEPVVCNLEELVGVPSYSAEKHGTGIDERNATPRDNFQKLNVNHTRTPKSILLSNRKENNVSVKKTVVFGYFEAALFNVGSPSSSMTPMHQKSVRENLIPMTKEIEKTTELEDEITRVIENACDPSLMLPIDESRIEDVTENDTSSIEPTSLQLSGEERTEELETNIDVIVYNNEEESEFSLPSVSKDSREKAAELTCKTSVEKLVVENSEMSIEDTLNLDQNALARIQGYDIAYSLPVDETQTVDIEGTMVSLLDAAGNHSSLSSIYDKRATEMKETASIFSDKSKINESEVDISQRSLLSFSQLERHPASTLTVQLESDVDALLEVSSQSINLSVHTDEEAGVSPILIYQNQTLIVNDKSNMTDTTKTMQLDANLELLLEEVSLVKSQTENDSKAFHTENVDNSMSELGMTTSHEPLHIFQDSTSLTDSVVRDSLDPINLKLEEVLHHGRVDIEVDEKSERDIFLSVLCVASKVDNSTVRRESNDVMTQICYDIESQVATICLESRFAAIIEKKQDLMRRLESSLRLNVANVHDKSCMKERLRMLFRSAKHSILSEWKTWLTEVAVVYNDQLFKTVNHDLDCFADVISKRAELIDHNIDQVVVPSLNKSARRITKKSYRHQKIKVMQYDNEVFEWKTQVDAAARELLRSEKRYENIVQISKLDEQAENLRQNIVLYRRSADTSFYKFFSVERLHNWLVTDSVESHINLMFPGPSFETKLQVSFTINSSSTVTVVSNICPLSRSARTLLSNSGRIPSRFRPAIYSFLKKKISLLCNDLSNRNITSASKISTLTQIIELKLTRILQAAKEFNSILNLFQNSFLQPSETIEDGYDMIVYITSVTKDSRLQVTLSISDCYPFSPVGIQLYSTNKSFDTEVIMRNLKKVIKPGFGSLSRGLNAINDFLN